MNDYLEIIIDKLAHSGEWNTRVEAIEFLEKEDFLKDMKYHEVDEHILHKAKLKRKRIFES